MTTAIAHSYENGIARPVADDEPKLGRKSIRDIPGFKNPVERLEGELEKAKAQAASLKPAESAEPTVTVPPRTKPLPSERFREEQFGRLAWCVTLPSDVSYEEIFAPRFWRLVGRRLNIGDEITVRDDVLSFWARVIVVANDPVVGDAELRQLIYVPLERATVEGREKSGFSVEYRGLSDQWAIVRDIDGHTMAKGIRSRDEALSRVRIEWLPTLGTQGFGG